MSWVTVIWSMAASACLTLAALHLLVWCRKRIAWAKLLFSLTATATTLVAAAAEAGTNDLAFVVKSWRTIDGLPQNSVNAMAQTPDGYLWVGTRGGLARFDGVRFRTYGLADGLKGLSIRALLEDGEGGLWIATRGGGLSHWRKGVISTLTTAHGLVHNDVLAFARAEAGGLWVGTSRGLQHLGPDGFKQIGKAEGVRGPVFGMAVSPAEGLWFNQENVGLFHYQDGRCELVEPAPKSRGLFPSSFLVDAEGALWIGMGNGVVLRRHAGEWQEFNQTNGVPFSYIYCLAQGHPGEIWAGSHEAGLYMFREGRFHAIPGTDASIRSVKVSRDGVVWVGTQSGGLSRLAPARAASYRVGDETRRGQVNGLVETPPSQFWVTTFGGGLFRGTMDRLEPVLGSQELNDLPFLNAGVSMRDGTLFFAGQKGLWRKDAGTGKIRGTILPDNPRALCEGVDGSLWLGTWEGELKRLVEGTPQVVKGGTFPAPVTGLVCGSGPALWVATHGAGLFRWEAGQAQWWTTAEGLPTDILLSLDWDAAGTLWIGTAGGGLAWLEKGRFHSVDARQGLGDSVVSQILEDGQGNLWLGCNRGIMRLSKGELRDVASGKAAAVHPLVLDESDGILTAECTGGYSPAGLRSRSGALYFSTVRGVVAVDPARFGPTPVPPAVLIEEVKLDGKTIPMSGGAFSLPPGPRELQIQYTAFNYAKPEQIRFRYRLQGGDEHWVEVEGARSVRFSQLRPGDYTFQVSAANQDGRWRETGASLAFTVLPFYWQTGWFRVVGALLFMGSGGGAVIWRNRAKRRLELVEMERLRRQSAERRQADEKFRLVVEASTNGIVLVNHSGRIVLVNAQTEELFGCSREKLIGQPVEMLVPERLRGAHPGQRAGFLAAPRARTMGAGRELFALRKDGMEFPVEIGLSPIQTAEGILVLTAIVDITARKQAEAEASRQRAELAHVARVSTMGELAASVAHELNQPLGAILANAEAADLFLNQNPPALDELRAILVDIRQDDERASEVIRRMRALLRKHELERLPLQINSVVEDVLQVVSGDAALRKIAIGAELALGLPKILGDRVHLQQVLLNLMLNGMDAMAGEPRERRRLSIRTRSSADGLVELAVVDSGHGIEPEKLPRLFEAFYTTKPNGMGMGLSISRTIIEAHHGRISAENNPSGGATFRVTLPVGGEGQVAGGK